MNNHCKISASLMCADLGNLEREIEELERVGVDWLHIDVMDGHFVPNFTFGPNIVQRIRQLSALPLDIHLMIENPERYINIWDLTSKDVISFHIEAANHPQRIIEQIKTLGARPAIAVNPATPLSFIQHLLAELDMVVLMTVNPGFSGQKWLPWIENKIIRFFQFINNSQIKMDIEVDGNLGAHNIHLLKKAGANIFVAGSSSLFKSKSYSENLLQMRQWFESELN